MKKLTSILRRLIPVSGLIVLLSLPRLLRAQTDTLLVDGVEREYHVHVPRQLDTSSPVPLLIVLHGGSGNMRQMERYTGFSQLADQENFIVVYPQGINNRWNDGRIYEGSATTDDVAFIAALLDHLIATLPIDPARIYATGISNGGFLSYRLGCELSERLAGIAPVTSNLSEDLAPDCHPTTPIKILVMNGTGDPLVPYDGGYVTLERARGAIRSTAETMSFWAAHNGCDEVPEISDLPDTNLRDRSRAQLTRYTDCKTETQLITLIDGGHTWPGRAQYLPVFLVGRVNRDVDATQVIWDFFSDGM